MSGMWMACIEICCPSFIYIYNAVGKKVKDLALLNNEIIT